MIDLEERDVHFKCQRGSTRRSPAPGLPSPSQPLLFLFFPSHLNSQLSSSPCHLPYTAPREHPHTILELSSRYTSPPDRPTSNNITTDTMNSLPLPVADLDATKVATSPFGFDDRILSSNLQKRYTTISIPATYGRLDSGPTPGVVAGIVLGTVGGVCLILYLTFLTLNPGGLARGSASSIIDEEEVVVRSRRGGSSRRSDVIEVVEERDRRDEYRRRRAPDRVVVEESTTGTETTDESRDFIEVVEEESSGLSTMSPPRRPKSYRSGVRRVDPHEYGGGSSRASLDY